MNKKEISITSTRQPELIDQFFKEIQKGNITEVKRLIEEEAVDVNTTINNGGTALTRAVFWENLNIVKYLISKGADVNATEFYNRTILMRAISGRLDIVKYLVSNGADVNAKDINGWTALDLAKLKERDEIATFLKKKISKSALDKNAIFEKGNTFLKTQIIKFKFLTEFYKTKFMGR